MWIKSYSTVKRTQIDKLTAMCGLCEQIFIKHQQLLLLSVSIIQQTREQKAFWLRHLLDRCMDGDEERWINIVNIFVFVHLRFASAARASAWWELLLQ